MDDLPLLPSTIKQLIAESLADGGWRRRRQIIKDILRLNEVRGGAKPHQRDFDVVVKKCLQVMKDAGLIEGGRGEGQYGHYRLSQGTAASPAAGVVATSAAAVEPAASVTAPPESPSRSAGMEAARVIGQGDQSVYVYFYESDRVHAQTQGRASWPCKVGLATRDAAGRLREQGAITSRSAAAVWALEIRTADAATLERAIHRVLLFAGREAADGGGAEWFRTTPAMVEAVYLQLEAIRRWPE